MPRLAYVKETRQYLEKITIRPGERVDVTDLLGHRDLTTAIVDIGIMSPHNGILPDSGKLVLALGEKPQLIVPVDEMMHRYIRQMHNGKEKFLTRPIIIPVRQTVWLEYMVNESNAKPISVIFDILRMRDVA